MSVPVDPERRDTARVRRSIAAGCTCRGWSAGVVHRARLELSANVCRDGEPTRFRPGTIVYLDGGSSPSGPDCADIDWFDKHHAQHEVRIRDQRVCDAVDRVTNGVRCAETALAPSDTGIRRGRTDRGS
jgi:hypothetical protein